MSTSTSRKISLRAFCCVDMEAQSDAALLSKFFDLEKSTPEEVIEALRDGVHLCRWIVGLNLATVPQSPPRSRSKTFHERPRNPMFMRDNVAVFLNKCVDSYGVPQHMLFDASDLVDMRKPNALCQSLVFITKKVDPKTFEERCDCKAPLQRSRTVSRVQVSSAFVGSDNEEATSSRTSPARKDVPALADIADDAAGSVASGMEVEPTTDVIDGNGETVSATPTLPMPVESVPAILVNDGAPTAEEPSPAVAMDPQSPTSDGVDMKDEIDAVDINEDEEKEVPMHETEGSEPSLECVNAEQLEPGSSDEHDEKMSASDSMGDIEAEYVHVSRDECGPPSPLHADNKPGSADQRPAASTSADDTGINKAADPIADEPLPSKPAVPAANVVAAGEKLTTAAAVQPTELRPERSRTLSWPSMFGGELSKSDLLKKAEKEKKKQAKLLEKEQKKQLKLEKKRSKQL